MLLLTDPLTRWLISAFACSFVAALVFFWQEWKKGKQ
jgi:hypothetical protein